jgi:serpin B
MKDVSEVDNFKDGVVTRIKGTIPFFNFDYDLSLSDDLKSLGVVDVFDEDRSDLSRMTSLEYSYIHEALHKANIEFSNDGIRAAAATAIVGGMGSGGAFDYQWEIPIEDIDLTFDKPFLFIVRDKASGEIWFAGTVYNPAN